METHIAKWGNSLAIRLPKPVVDALRLKEQEEIMLRVEEETLVITPKSRLRSKYKKFTLENLIAGMTAANVHDAFSEDDVLGEELL